MKFKHGWLACSAIVAATSPVLAQLRVVTLNAANATDLGDVSTPRTPWMSTILTAIGTSVSDDPTLAGNTGIAKPIDVLCLQEVTSPATTSSAYRNLLNSLYPGANYQYSTVGGGTTGAGTQGLIYNANAVTLVGTTAVGTSSTSGQPRQALRYQLSLVGYDSSSDIFIYNSHYKAGDTTTDEGRRLPEAQAIRTNADGLGAGKNIMYLGDFNMYRSTDPAYQHLLSAGDGQAFDPINKPGNWNNSSTFTNIHTQSPFNSSTASSEGSGFSGTSGGMDDRFDFQLISAGMNDGDGVAYITNSYQAFGNNGTHGINNPIDTASNTAQPANVKTALAAILDHLPVVADYQLPAKLSATAGTAPTRVIKNASANISVSVWNSAPVSFANGADQLSYSLGTSGSLSGASSGTDNALGTTNTHTVALSTTTTGAKSGSYSVTSSSQQVGGSAVNQNVNYDVVDHANASFASPTDANAQTIDFGYVPAGFANRTSSFSIYNLVQTAGYTASLDIDSVVNAGDTSRLSTNVTATLFNPIAAGAQRNYTATLSPAVSGNFTATHTIANSDENITGATSGTSLVLTTTARVLSVANFPVSGSLNLLNGETWNTGPASISASVTLTKLGPGTLYINAAQSHGTNSALGVSGGLLVMDTDAGSAAAAPLAISLANTNTFATFNSTEHLRALVLGASTTASVSADGNRALYTNVLSLNPTAKLDLGDNDLVVNNSGASIFTDVQALVFAGYSSAPDPEKTGIISTVGQNAGNTILALFDNVLVGITEWPPGSGETISANAIVGKYTYFGDMNLDGQVSGDDYGIVDANLNATPDPGVAWLSGDANLDSQITGDDYGVLDANLGLGTGSPLALSQFVAPEPSLIGFTIASLLTTRRQRSRRSPFGSGIR